MRIPKKVIVACSGGPDSMAIVDFLRRGYSEVQVAFFDHGTVTSRDSRCIVDVYAKKHGMPTHFGAVTGNKEKRESLEMFWRRQRYEFLLSIPGDDKIITCHHLDDQIENWIMTSLKGIPQLIPYTNGRIIRPFLMTGKDDLLDWCDRKNVEFYVDMSNFDRKYSRNVVRHDIMPHALKINPGLRKTISKMVKRMYDSSDNSKASSSIG